MASGESKAPSELRQDLVCGDWVAIATARARRPDAFAGGDRPRFSQPLDSCPFETLHPDALVAYASDGKPARAESWWVQAIPNKYPAFGSGQCAVFYPRGPYQWTQGAGFHEVVITRDHTRSIAVMDNSEVRGILRVYRDRMVTMREDACIKYVSVFHNHGKTAGASVTHPHSQIIALPVVPPDVGRSIRGSETYFHQRRACVHCAIIDWEIKAGERIIYENDRCVVVAPFASKTAFETRIFPRRHSARFEEATDEEYDALADALRTALAKLARGLDDPDYNFFIHTAPVEQAGETDHYHWHMEIMPKTAVWAGFEIGTGIEISTIAPEDAATFLKGVS
jgi:UDPglucose--hexose-1-phosphate uridylyltransferase